MEIITDCDYCGEITLCYEDGAGGTSCYGCCDDEPLDEELSSLHEYEELALTVFLDTLA